MSEENWVKAKTKKAFYLPTVGGGSFDDSGKRVEVADSLELLKGSNKIRLNGVPFIMNTACDTIIRLIDKDGFIVFAKPAPPARIGMSGASVGRMGQAVYGRKTDADADFPKGYEHMEGNHDPEAPRTVRGFPVIREEDSRPVRRAHSQQGGFFGSGTSRSLNPSINETVRPRFDAPLATTDTHAPDGRKYTTEEQEVIAELHAGLADDGLGGTTEYREVILKDGSKAKALFDKVTGRQVGTPIRNYTAHYKDGVQIGSPLDSFGSAAARERGRKEYKDALAAQAKDTTLAPTGHDRERYDHRPEPVAPVAHTAHPAVPAVPAMDAPLDRPVTFKVGSTGIPHLDDLIGGPPKLCTGIPLGDISHFCGPTDLMEMLAKSLNATPASSMTDAIGKAVMASRKTAPSVIGVSLGPITDEVRLDLAEGLPALKDTIKGFNLAVVILTPDYGDDIPALLQYMTCLSVALEPHPRDQRFVTATVRKCEFAPSQDATTSFPKP